MKSSYKTLLAGDKSVLIELESLEETLALFNCLREARVLGIREIIPAARTLLINYEFGVEFASIERELRRCILKPKLNVSLKKPPVEIRVLYDGQDLGEVAELLKTSPEEIIKRHGECSYFVAFNGFAPGFSYLVGNDRGLIVPRREVPRARIEGGSVGLAGEFSGIYPKPSPGGWQIIGHTEQIMWDLNKEEPALLKPMDRVKFINERGIVRKIFAPPKHEERKKRGDLKVISTSLLASFQDLGRNGREIGLSPSGAMDEMSLKSANIIVGNPASSPCIEITLGGFRAEARAPMLVAFIGALSGFNIKTIGGRKIRARSYYPYQLEIGDQISLEHEDIKRGLRSYLAVRGGFKVEKILGSASFDALCNIGMPLKDGDFLELAFSTDVKSVSIHEEPPKILPKLGEEIKLDCFLGPRTDYFTNEAIDLFLSTKYIVSNESNRIGLRLLSDVKLKRKITEEIPSEGVVTGSVQVPTSGLPIIFLKDHPVTAGYPIIAVIASHHLDLAGQIRVGEIIKFNAIPRDKL